MFPVTVVQHFLRQFTKAEGCNTQWTFLSAKKSYDFYILLMTASFCELNTVESKAFNKFSWQALATFFIRADKFTRKNDLRFLPKENYQTTLSDNRLTVRIIQSI